MQIGIPCISLNQQTQHTMKQIKAGELKVGDQLADTTPSKYGQYVNISVTSIRTTAKGRLVIMINCQYQDPEGNLQGFQNTGISHGAISANTLIKVK